MGAQTFIQDSSTNSVMYYAFDTTDEANASAVLVLALVLVVATAPVLGPGLNRIIWFFTYRFTIWPIAVVLPLFAVLGIAIPMLSSRAAQRYSVVERLRQE